MELNLDMELRNVLIDTRFLPVFFEVIYEIVLALPPLAINPLKRVVACC